MTTQSDLSLVWAAGGGQTDPGSAKYSLGWVAEIPTFQNFNYVLSNTTKNILVSAEQGQLFWEAGIQYQAGASVIDSGKLYVCHTASLSDSVTGAQPSLDTTFSYWSTGAGLFGPAAVGNLEQTDGILIDGVNSRATATTWDGNDVTIKNSNAVISFNINNATVGTPNWSLGNVNGEMILVDNGVTVRPDGKSIIPGAASVSRIYHEAHPPTQSEVAGTIPDAPADGPIYGRSLTNWVKVTSTTVSTSPPPPVAGSGQGWYNLDDGTTYVDVDDGDSSQWVPASPPVLPDVGPAVISTVVTADNPTWTPNVLTKTIEFTVIGAGAGGGGADGQGSGTNGAGAGGGAGGASVILTSTIDSTYAIVIGSGGSGGSGSGGGNGGPGGLSSVISTTLNLLGEGGGGGAGDVASASTTSWANGGLGGDASGGDLNLTGQDGSSSRVIDGLTSSVGDSGGSLLGGGVRGRATDSGRVGGAFGAGGGGGGSGNNTTNYSGGAGANGVVLIKEYT